jgi:hypothetical protein
MQSRLTAFCYVRISRSGFCATVETCGQELRKIQAETAAVVLQFMEPNGAIRNAGRQGRAEKIQTPRSSPQDQLLVV